VSDIFREVDEEVRQDEYRRLWDRYGIYVIGLGLAIVLGVGGYKGWQAYQKSRAQAAGERFATAVSLAAQDKQQEAARMLAELSEDGPRGYATLARFRQAALLAGNGERQRAVAVYDRLADDDGINPVMRGLARMRAALLLLDQADRREIERRIGTLNTPDNPWRNGAREALALAAYKAGDYAAADRLYREILADPAAPGNLRQRAQVMLSLLAPSLPDKVAGEAAASGGD